MNFLRSPRNKLFAAAFAVLVLALLAPTQGVSPSVVARVLVGVLGAAGLGWWFLRHRRGGGALLPAPRLQVLARTGLSQRCGMALVEADGRNYLVVFGDGFAELQEAKLAFPVRQGRRPRPPRRSASRPVARKGGGR